MKNPIKFRAILIVYFSIITFQCFSQDYSLDTTLALKYYKLGDKFFSAYQLDSSTSYYKKAAEVYKQFAERDKETLMYEKHVSCLYNISRNYISQAKYSNSIELLDSSLTLSLKYLGEKNKQTANIYYGFGAVYSNKGENEKSYEYHQKALKIRLQLFGENHPDVAASYNKIGLYYYNINDYDNALEFLEKALNIRIEYFGDRHSDVAASYNNIANVYYSKNEYDIALEYHLKSLGIKIDVLGQNHPDVATAYYNMGLVYCDKSEFEKALEYYHKALDIRLLSLNENNPDLGDVFYNIGFTYFKRDYYIDYDKALEYIEKAKNIRIANYGEKDPDVANALNLIGSIYFEKGGRKKVEYDKAMEYFQKALDIRLIVLGEKHPDVAISYNNIGRVYRQKLEYELALEYYQKALIIEIETLGEKHAEVINSYFIIEEAYKAMNDYDKGGEYHLRALLTRLESLDKSNPDLARSNSEIGKFYYKIAKYDNALEYYQNALQIELETLGEKNRAIIDSYYNIAKAYDKNLNFDKALEYYQKSIIISIEILGEKDPGEAITYCNIASIYSDKGYYDKALEYYQKDLSIKLETLHEDDLDLADTYHNIGITNFDKGENDKALEYYQKALNIRLRNHEENTIGMAASYEALGGVYSQKGEYDKALDYYQKTLKIQLIVFDEKYIGNAFTYLNIAGQYIDKGEYDKALEYCTKAINIQLDKLGEKHPDVASSLNMFGRIYRFKYEFDKALEYHQKAVKILLEIYIDKHPKLAFTYYCIGIIYSNKGEYLKALEYYQKALCSNLVNFNDTINFTIVPEIKDYLDSDLLLESLFEKAWIFATKNINGFENKQDLEIAVSHYLALDTLISKVRQEITSQSDKLNLSESANQIYNEAIAICLKLANIQDAQSRAHQQYRELAFYFSEKNKSSVLLEALAGQEAQNFAGIPDSLLKKEHDLKVDIAFYTKQLASPEILQIGDKFSYQSKLFNRNRNYDSLIIAFETQFPEYHNLKYNKKNTKIEDIRKLLDKKTAMISYAVGDSTITIFMITQKELDVISVPKMKKFEENIENFRKSMTSEIRSYIIQYGDLAFLFYKQLFPFLEQNKSFEGITDLILIPDGELSTIPFEALLTEKSDVNFLDYKVYKNLPYLLNRFNISYSYSATLFNKTFSPKKKQKPEFSDLKDWIALAPVFDDKNVAGLTAFSRNLKEQMKKEDKDSLLTREFYMANGDYISPLPGSESEVRALFTLFESQNKSAVMKLRGDANEEFIKSGELSKYKIIHIATHGMVNTEKPELSCILLSQVQDTTNLTHSGFKNSNGSNIEQNDGILYSGEIFNLKLNADLVVLSACETGLGKVKSGEGIIGLTRALLYAGTKNIVVSLWPVSDASTSELMIDFYNNLSKINSGKYIESLRSAKLKLISGGNYSHPFYWSPFILIGN